ncbi:MAG: glutamate 5-kinase, partial [Candidatus Omnitrophica bacterium]|nr:glutamate 5-kinase [Candidatus Omnitrophota bacterium]
SRLMRLYERSFRDLGLNVGQVLLTRDIFRVPRRKAIARQTLETLLSFGVIPIINENDSVAIEELKFGDNDTLAALVAELLQADLLLILTGVRGLYEHDPRRKKGKVIAEVRSFNKKIAQLGKNNQSSDKGIGGIASKLRAAKYVTERGMVCVIAWGKRSSTGRSGMAGKPVGTFFWPQKTKDG